MTLAPVLPKATAVGVGLDRESWLELRAEGLGGSDIAAVLGLSPFKSALALYLEKSGEVEDDFKETDAMRWGNILEQPIAEQFSEETQLATYQPPNITIYRSTELAIAQASPDRLQTILSPGAVGFEEHLAHNGVVGWVEIKNVGAHRRDDWLDADGNVTVPVHYEAQAQWELAVSGLPHCHVVCLLGGQQLVHTAIMADPLLHADLFAAAETFWKRLDEHNPPTADGSDSTTKVLKRRFGTSEPGSAIDGGPELAALVFELAQAKAEAKTASQREKAAENAIKVLLREHEIGRNGELELVTWKTSQRNGYTVEPTTTRRLLLGKDAR